MVAVVEKELIFSKTFTVIPKERVWFQPSELKGGKLSFITREQTAQGDLPPIEGIPNPPNEITFILLSSNNVGFTWLSIERMGDLPEGPLSGRIFVHTFLDLVQVQLDVHLDRRPNYGQR